MWSGTVGINMKAWYIMIGIIMVGISMSYADCAYPSDLTITAPGTYSLSGNYHEIYINSSDVTLNGPASNYVIANGVIAVGVQNININDVTFRSDSNSNPGCTIEHALSFNNVQNVNITNVRLIAGVGSNVAVYLKSSSYIDFNNVSISTIDFGTGSTNALVLESSSHNSFNNNLIMPFWTPVSWNNVLLKNGSTNNVFTDGQVTLGNITFEEGSDNNTIMLKYHDLLLINSSHNTISNTIASGTPTNNRIIAIFGSAASNNLYMNNSRGSVYSAETGEIIIQGSNNTFVNNTVEEALAPAFKVQGNNNIFVGNQIWSYNGHGWINDTGIGNTYNDSIGGNILCKLQSKIFQLYRCL